MSMLVATEKGKGAIERVTRCLETVREFHTNPDLSANDATTLIRFDADLSTLQSTLSRLSAEGEAALSEFDTMLDDVHAYCDTVEEGISLLKGATYEHA